LEEETVVSSYATHSLNNELDKLNDSYQELRTSYEDLITFILGENFLEEYNKFEKLIADFQARIVTLVEVLASQSPETKQLISQSPQSQGFQLRPEGQKQERWSREKIVIIAAVLILLGIATYQGYIPAETLQWAVAGTLILTFLPEIIHIVHDLFKEPEEEKAPNIRLEEWIHTRLRWIRERHFQAWTLIISETQSKEILNEYETLGIDPVVYNKREYFKKRLAFEFLNITGEILSACNSNIWTRKNIIISAIVAAQAPLGVGAHGS